MQEISGDIWAFHPACIIAVTTNGSVSQRGRIVIGRGVAAQAAARYPEIVDLIGQQVSLNGNHVHQLPHKLVTFPVEHSSLELPDLRLIERSAAELARLADQQGWEQIIVPRPGCGGGGLLWKDVRPLLLPHLDDRFTIISAVNQ